MSRSIVFTAMFWLWGPLAQAATAPDFELPTAESLVRLSDLRGRVVLVDFWAAWCGPCRQSFPWMNRMQAEYGKEGLTIVAINVDQESELARAFLAELPSQFTVAFDPAGKTPERFGVMGMPSSYVINRHGEIVATHIGFHADRTGEYEATLQQILAQ